MAFVDYKKAFDSIELCHILKSLKSQEIPDKYSRIIKKIYEMSKITINIEKNGENFHLERGVKQGDPMSPKLFNAVLESIFRNLSWNDLGIKIGARTLNNLRYADDLVIFANTKTDLIAMLGDLKRESKAVGLEINEEKTKIMNNSDDDNNIIEGSKIDVVEDFKYLSQIVSFKNRQS